MQRAKALGLGLCGIVLAACGQSPPSEVVAQQAERLTAPTQVNTFALLSSGHVKLGDRIVLTGGNIGVSAGTGDSLTEGADGQMALGKSTLGQRIVLKERAHAGDLFGTAPSPGPGATYTSLSAYANPPAQPPIIAFSAGTGTTTISVPTTLAAGNFGEVNVNSTLTLSGGTYQIQNLTLATNAVVQASAASIVRVAGKISGGNFVHLVPTGTQAAGTLRLIVAGTTDAAGGVVLGTDARVTALVVSRASVSVADRFVGKGAIAARDITVTNDSSFTFQTGFECNVDSACNDNNACTTDTCVDAKCVHTAVPNGTLCPDEGNICTTDVCSNAVCTHPAVADGTACTSDSNECTTDRCTAGLCTHPAVANGTACTDDGNTCTSDACASGVCAHPALANGTACPNEGNPCTDDVCQSGACAHPAVADGTVCPSDGVQCTNDVCAAGMCAHPAVPDGTPCLDDTLTCTDDKCLSGVCSHPAVPDGTHCDNDDNDCTTDACASGSCTHAIVPGVCQVADAVTPIFNCIMPAPGGGNRAVFGYDNPTDTAVKAKPGAGNAFSPTPAVRGQPSVFQPGHFDNRFAVDIVTSSITWQLGSHKAVASTSGPACSTDGCSTPCESGEQCVAGSCVTVCGDGICSHEDCTTCPFDCGCVDHPKLHEAERPDPVSFEAASAIGPDIHTLAFNFTPNPVFGGNFTTTAPEKAPFTFKVTALDFTGSELFCGTVDPYVKKLIIDGHDLGQVDHGTVQVSRTQPTVHVHVEIYDSDGGLCFGDEKLGIFDDDLDNYAPGSGCPSNGNGTMCWSSTGAASPGVCFDWHGQYVDAGPWNGGAGSEDFLTSKSIQAVPASFSRIDATITRGGSVVYQLGGFLDQDGCIRAEQRPGRELWAPGDNVVATFRLSSQMCLNPDGDRDCPGTIAGAAGANVVIFPLDPNSGDPATHGMPSTGPASICTILAEDPSQATDPSCVVQPISWTGLPPDPIVPENTEEDSVTRTAAVISHILAREEETNGALGIKLAMIDRRLEGNHGIVKIDVDKYCCLDDAGLGFLCWDARVTKRTSCRGTPDGTADGGIADQNTLDLEPDGVSLSGTHFKYVVAHEFGHFIQGAGQGLMHQDYDAIDATTLADANLCTCSEVPSDDNLHCLQSVEEPNAAQVEGFGQYFASKVWNDDAGGDCTFVYYKNFGDSACRPGVSGCFPDSNTGLTVNPPPMPVNCMQQAKWRNQKCLGSSPSADLLASGTEYDWLEFLYGIGKNPTVDARWSMKEIFDAYTVACGGNNASTPTSCQEALVNWAGATSPPAFSLRDGAQALAAAGKVSLNARNAFLQAGDDFGVSTKPP